MSFLDGQISPFDALAIGLLGGQSPNFGQNLLQALNYQQTIMGAQDRRKHDDLTQKMMAAQLEQMKQAQEDAAKRRALGAQFMRPGAAPSLTPNDDEGNPMPSTAPSFDLPGYLNASVTQGLMDPLQMAQLTQKQQPKVHAVSEGQILMDENGRLIGKGTPKREGPEIGKTREIESGDKKLTYEWDGKQWTKIAEAPRFKPDTKEPDKAPQGYRWKGDGTLEAIPGGPAEKQPSEAELTAAGYAGRMQAAEQTLAKVADKGLPSKGTVAASMLPLGAQGKRFAERQIMSPEQQQYRQAQEDWVRAKLRKESGAVIADDEMQREIETYFPQLGDSQQVIAQKAIARQTAIRAMNAASGKAGKSVSDVANGWSIRPLQ